MSEELPRIMRRRVGSFVALQPNAHQLATARLTEQSLQQCYVARLALVFTKEEDDSTGRSPLAERLQARMGEWPKTAQLLKRIGAQAVAFSFDMDDQDAAATYGVAGNALLLASEQSDPATLDAAWPGVVTAVNQIQSHGGLIILPDERPFSTPRDA